MDLVADTALNLLPGDEIDTEEGPFILTKHEWSRRAVTLTLVTPDHAIEKVIAVSPSHSFRRKPRLCC